ncbi:conserved hypothetical protein [Burkholderia vietnamiensis]|nr:conserved hypothetical protein [Burkholderia vietnamiensis]
MCAGGGGGDADRRRAAGVHAAGRAGGGRAEPVDAAVDRRAARRAVRAVRSVGRHRARVLHRLADELLDHGPVRARVRREPAAAALSVARRGAQRRLAVAHAGVFLCGMRARRAARAAGHAAGTKLTDSARAHDARCDRR